MGAQRVIALTSLLLAVQLLTGCAVAHRYPAYKGQVLELGTDKPIEGAGVIAKYKTVHTCVGGEVTSYLGYQGRLTDAEGWFEIRPKWFVPLRPLSWFDTQVRITIFKYGYGNYPGSFGPPEQHHPEAMKDPVYRGRVITKYGAVEPPPFFGADLEPNRAYTFWLPKLETEDDLRRHYRRFDKTIGIGTPGFPPPGTTTEQFGYGSPDKLWRKTDD